MKDDRSSLNVARARARRRAAGLVAQYVHELSERHAVARETALKAREAVK